jgi:hypothetical protein
MRLPILALIAALAPGLAAAASLDVPLDQAIRLTLSAPAHDVIVGNPSIADVEVSDQRHLVLTGKMGGVTNLIVVDERGRTLINRQIVVSDGGSSGSRVAFISGPTLATYVCTPGCTMVSTSTAPGIGTAPLTSQPPMATAPVVPTPAPSNGPGPSPAQP